jgi:hypothetical protein
MDPDIYECIGNKIKKNVHFTKKSRFMGLISPRMLSHKIRCFSNDRFDKRCNKREIFRADQLFNLTNQKKKIHIETKSSKESSEINTPPLRNCKSPRGINRKAREKIFAKILALKSLGGKM